MNRELIPYTVFIKSGHKGQALWSMDHHCGRGLVYPIVICPLCNKIFSLKLHKIGLKGEVNNSILCLCKEWHIFAVLDKWEEVVGKVKEIGMLFV